MLRVGIRIHIVGTLFEEQHINIAAAYAPLAALYILQSLLLLRLCLYYRPTHI